MASRANRSTFERYGTIETHRADLCTPREVRACGGVPCHDTHRLSGDGYIQGVELGASWGFAKGWVASGNFAWSEGEVGQFNNGAVGVFPASRIHPLTAQLGLRWESDDARWWAEGSAILARHQDRLSPGDMGDTQRIPPGGTHGYAVYHLRAGDSARCSVREERETGLG